MALVKFYRGSWENYELNKALYVDGIYFVKGTGGLAHKIMMGGNAYGLSDADATKLNTVQENVIESVSLNGTTLDIVGKNVNINLQGYDTRISALEADIESLTGGDGTSISAQLQVVRNEFTAADAELETKIATANTNITNENARAVAEEEALGGRIDALTTTVSSNLSAAKTYADSLINSLDKIDDGNGIVTKVNQTNGLVEVTHSALTSKDSTIKVDGLDLTVNVDGTTILKDSNGVLSVNPTAFTEYTGENAILVDSDTSKISLKLVENDAILANTVNGLSATVTMSYDSDNKKIKLFGKDGVTPISEVDATAFIKDGMLESVELRETDDNLVFTFNTDAGTDEIAIPLSKFTDVYEGINGVNIDGKEVSIKLNATDNEFLSVDASGLKVSGVTAAINSAVAAEAGLARAAEQANADAIAAEIALREADDNAIESAVGLNEDGTYKDTDKSNAIYRGATSVMGAVEKLDEAIRTNKASIGEEGSGGADSTGLYLYAETLASAARSAAITYADGLLAWEDLN